MKDLRGIAYCSWLACAVGLLLGACENGNGGNGGNGGKAPGSGGSQAASGGNASGGSTANATTASGGSVGAGGSVGTGGANPGSGGATAGSGGGGASVAGGRSGSGGAGAGGTSATTGSGGASGAGGRTGAGGGASGATSAGGSYQGGSLGRDGGLGGLARDGGGRLDGQAGTGGIGAGGGTAGAGGSTAQGGSMGEGGTTSTGPCTVTDWGTPPAGDVKWIDESWASQLGNNVKTRKEWLLDSAIQGKGQINVCVRWGATSAPSADLKSNIGSWVEKWFNDWFKNLSGYACFPYSHITAKVTGWAVRKGNESWVSDLDSTTIKVYTDVETGSDPPNEPKCADACSFFTADGKGAHSFPSCPGGEAFHFDYAMWLDDRLPGSGAAAVGGDWGLRMPAADFISLKGSASMVVEHEMGHGFGFQDYYDWTQDKPSDGSLMVIGSTSSQTPTPADVWLLRRTWKEVKALRGW
jgi:hypothetical protein